MADVSPAIRTAAARSVVERFCAAMSHDLPTMAALMDEGYRRFGMETGWQPMSKARYLKMAENFVVPFPDCRWEVLSTVAEGSRVAVDLIESGTFTQPWTVGGVTIEPNGDRYEMRGAVFFTVNDLGLISDYTYLHTGTFSDQFAGVMNDDFYVAYAEEFLVAEPSG